MSFYHLIFDARKKNEKVDKVSWCLVFKCESTRSCSTVNHRRGGIGFHRLAQFVLSPRFRSKVPGARLCPCGVNALFFREERSRRCWMVHRGCVFGGGGV